MENQQTYSENAQRQTDIGQSGYGAPLSATQHASQYVPSPVQPEVVVQPAKESLFARNQRNKPQANSLSAAGMIFFSGGMEIAWGLFGLRFAESGLHAVISWFIAVIIGALIASFTVTKIEKRFFYYVSAVLVIISGIIYVSTTDVSAFIAARYLNGLAFGLAILPAIIAGGEVALPSNRGLVLSTESILLNTGIFVELAYSEWSLYTFPPVEDSERVHGILTIVCGSLSIVFNLLFTIESPIFLLKKNNERDALLSLQKLQSRNQPTSDILKLLEEHNKLIAEDEQRLVATSAKQELLALLKLTLLRCITGAFSISWPISFVYDFTSFFGLELRNKVLYGICRWFGIIVSGAFIIDKFGRKKISIFSLLVGSIFLIVLGLYLTNLRNSTLTSVAIIVLCYQFVTGLMIPVSTTHLAEAFSLSIKPFYIFFAIFIENLVQIITCYAMYNAILIEFSTFFYIFGGIQLAFFLLYIFDMPETTNLTLRECRDKFRNFFK